ncbi:MAG: sulfatase [Tepidisphaeraceae bacterium]
MYKERLSSRFALGLSLSMAVTGAVGSTALARQPNIVLIVADDLGYADLSSYGSKAIPTPHIDALAKSGIRFTNGYSSGAICSPSRAGLLTGRYQARFGLEANTEEKAAPESQTPRALDKGQITLAQRLKSAGYVTGAFGKWHLGATDGYLPTQRGFDEFYGLLPYGIGSNPPYGPPVYRGTAEVPKPANHVEQFAIESLSFIDRNADKPFFLYVPLTAVHGPFVGAKPWIDEVDSQVPANRRRYEADVRQLDDVVGRLVSRIKEKGLEKETLILFYGDNGGPGGASDNGVLKGTKWTLWEGGIRVPFIVSWKDHIKPELTLNQPVIQIDLAPTALAAAGVTPPADAKFDGQNLLPFFEGKTAEAPHDTLFWRFGPQYAVRQGDWKLVKPHIDSKPLLFNLANDIGETKDLAATFPDRVTKLQKLWDDWNANNEAPRWGGAFWNGDGPAPKAKKAKVNTLAGATTRPGGPWKNGDVLEGDESPDIANKAITIHADVDRLGKEGVIVAQGGNRLGYAMYLSEGKLSFATRIAGTVSAITGAQALANGRHALEATLAEDGTLKLLVDGRVIAEGRSPGLFPRQPQDGLSVGDDTNSAVGDYSVTKLSAGTVSNVRVRTTATHHAQSEARAATDGDTQ